MERGVSRYTRKSPEKHSSSGSLKSRSETRTPNWLHKARTAAALYSEDRRCEIQTDGSCQQDWPGVELSDSGAHMHEPEPEPESVGPPTPAGAVSGQGDCAIVLWQYDAAEDDEMDLVEGELIEQIEEVNEGWWTGVGPGGKTGLFPSNYVEVVDDGTVAIALWDCEAANDNQISFKEGDKIVEIEFVSKDWWQGKDSAGNIGLFPATYVELCEQ